MRIITKFYLVIIVFILCSLHYVYAQKVELKNKEVKKLPTVELKKGEKSFPESFLYGMHGDSLILLTDISRWKDEPLFVQSKISINKYDYLTISHKAERRKKSLIWGTILGSISYVLVQKISKTKPEEVNVTQLITGQKPNSGQIEGVVAGITGFGLGMIIGQQLSKRKMDLKQQKRKALMRLREFSF